MLRLFLLCPRGEHDSCWCTAQARVVTSPLLGCLHKLSAHPLFTADTRHYIYSNWQYGHCGNTAVLFRRLEAAASYTLQGVLEKIAISRCVNHCNPSLTAAKMDMDAAFRENRRYKIGGWNKSSFCLQLWRHTSETQPVPPPPPDWSDCADIFFARDLNSLTALPLSTTFHGFCPRKCSFMFLEYRDECHCNRSCLMLFFVVHCLNVCFYTIYCWISVVVHFKWLLLLYFFSFMTEVRRRSL